MIVLCLILYIGYSINLSGKRGVGYTPFGAAVSYHPAEELCGGNAKYRQNCSFLRG